MAFTGIPLAILDFYEDREIVQSGGTVTVQI
jgi:hypothetical protein